ncbi:hypothetical protein N175_13215 [Vibrio anguillarum M3]|nr:hypothetical protein N175_13215 [Vibrio anguillarum M3]
MKNTNKCKKWLKNSPKKLDHYIETKQAWKVSIEDIIERNFNLDIKNPHQDEVISHDPEELLANYQQQQQDIKALRDQLKGILGDALSSTIQGKKQGGEQ